MTTPVVAVIVTFRRPDLLQACVEAVLSQTRPPDHVLVIDNDGANGVLLQRLEPAVRVIDAGANLGPAGGYALGIARALEMGAAAVWTVDDDCIPEPACLAALLATADGAQIMIPVQRTPEGDGTPPSWNGTLFDESVFRAVGGPDPEWFFWKEDIEFINRAADAGLVVRPVPDAIVVHRPRRRTPGTARDWRLYYETRNALTYRTRVRRRTWKDVPIAWRNALSTAWIIVREEPQKVRSLSLWCRGVADHLLHRMGPRVDPDRWTDAHR